MQPLAMLRAMRPHQWSKNVFVLAALGFAFGDQRAAHAIGRVELWHTLLAFFAFSLGSSAIYLVNDIVDVENDRAHPTKRMRPIAAGLVSIGQARGLAVVCFAASMVLGWLAAGRAWDVPAVVLGYVLMNLAYSLKLKRVVLVDAFCIAAGFVLRVLVGGLAARTEVSSWLLLCTLFLALFLALNKRRAEIAELGEDGVSHRKILAEYSIGFLDQMVTVLAACAILSYALYTVDPGTTAKYAHAERLIWSVPMVVFGVARYMLIVQQGRGGGSPTRIFLGGDPIFLGNLVVWLGVIAWGIL